MENLISDTVNNPFTDDEYCYKQLIHTLSVAVYMCNTSGFITRYNQAAVDLWGREPEIGKDLWCGSWRIYKPDGSIMSLDECPMAVTLKEQKAVYGGEIVLERPDGIRRFVQANPRPVFDEAGKLVGAVNMLIDITERKANEEKVARLAAIVQFSDDAIISKSLAGIVSSWNAAAERIFGYTSEEIVGKSVTLLIPPDRQEEEPLILERLKKGERVDHFETKRVTKDGRLLDISLTISPVKDSHGNIIGASKIVRDISEKKETERLISEKTERLKMAIASTKMGTWEYSPLTGSLNWSKECRHIYSVPEDLPVTYDLFSSLIVPADREKVHSAITEALDPNGSGNYDIQFRIIRNGDKGIRWIRSQGKVYFNEHNQAEKFIGTILDMTDDKTAKADLEKTVEERTEELKKVNTELARSNNELEEFAYVASHDLQEPLRKIKAFGDILSNRHKDNLDDESIHLIGRMQSASERMKTLIDDLLSYSRVSKSFNKELINTSKAIEEVLIDLDTVISEKKASIKFDKLFPIYGNALQVRQLFQNLLTNALKFNKPGIVPAITITARLVEADELSFPASTELDIKQYQLIEVCDNGIGFEQQYADKIFQVFQRLHGREEYQGSGVGLSIVQKVMKNHDGLVKAIGTPGEGACFQLFFPVSFSKNGN